MICEELVSIIVPIYNAEKNLKRCIDSILAQKYRNLEILLIDDGSIDNSLLIAQQYAEKDKRIQVFHQENKGVSSARNLGITKSNGKYMSFIDADDWVSELFIEKLVETIQGAELAIVGHNLCSDIIKPVLWSKDGEIDRETFFYEVLVKIHSGCWDKIFLTNIVKEKNIFFEEDVYFAEDTIFLMNYYRFCKKVKYCNDTLYQYVINNESATHVSKKGHFNIKRTTLLTLSDRVEEWYKNENEFIQNCIIYRRVRTYIYLIYHMIKCRDYHKEIAKNIQKEIRKYYVSFVKFEKVPISQKLATTVVYISPQFTYVIGKCLVGQKKE